jgi:CheY-like chemotaxis protein
MPRARLRVTEIYAQDGRAPDNRGKVLTLESRPHSSRAPTTRDGTSRAPRLLLAESDRAARGLLLPWLSELSAEIEEAHDGHSLEHALLAGGRFHLVIASARLPEPSALQVLARVRRQGVTTPFIVVTSVHGNMLRIFMSDSEGTVLSSRMVDGHNLASLICGMIDTQR